MNNNQLLHELPYDEADRAFAQFLLEDTSVQPQPEQVNAMWQHIQQAAHSTGTPAPEAPAPVRAVQPASPAHRRPRYTGITAMAAVWLVLVLGGVILFMLPRPANDQFGDDTPPTGSLDAARELVRLLLTTAEGPQLATTAVAGALPELPVTLPVDPSLAVIGGAAVTNGGYRQATLIFSSTLPVEETLGLYRAHFQSPGWRDITAEVQMSVSSMLYEGERLAYCYEPGAFFVHIAAAEYQPGITDVYIWIDNNSFCGPLDPALPTPSSDVQQRGTVTVTGEDVDALLRLAERLSTPIRQKNQTLTAVLGVLPDDLPIPLELHTALSMVGGVANEQRFSYLYQGFARITEERLAFSDILAAYDDVLLSSGDWTLGENHVYCYRGDQGLLRLEAMPSTGLVQIFVSAGLGSPCVNTRPIG